MLATVITEPCQCCAPVRHETSIYLGGRFEHVFDANGAQVRAYSLRPVGGGPHWIHLPAERLWVF